MFKREPVLFWVCPCHKIRLEEDKNAARGFIKTQTIPKCQAES